MHVTSAQAPEAAAEEPLPSGELVFKPRTALQRFGTSLKLIRALPWRRFKKGSVLTLEASLPLAAPCTVQQCMSVP